jgi:hypothetical protein
MPCHDAGVIRLTRLVRIAAVAGALAACGGRGFDARRLVSTCGLDCAADEVRFRLASSPRDRELYVALAEIEEQRARPSAAIEALDAAERLGRPFRGGLGDGERARLARLLLARAQHRVARGRPGADDDVTRARALGAKIPAALARDAALIAIAHDLRHVDPERRKRGRARLATVAPERAAALAGDGPADAIVRTARWLDEARAYRMLGEMLDELVRARGVGALRDMPGVADLWLKARRWWSGTEDRPDLLALEQAEAAGAGPCWYPRPRGPCDVIAAAAREEPAPWVPQLVTLWEREGVRATDRDTAIAWMIVARRAVDRGQLASWDRAVREHLAPDLDPASFAKDPRFTSWSAPHSPGSAFDAEAAGWPAVAASIAQRRAEAAFPDASGAAADARPVDRAALTEIAEAYGIDPALADRRADELIGRAADVAETAPVVAHLFSVLGDAPRARVLWQRAHDASPEDADVALGLAIAMAAAGDPAAGGQMMTRAAAGWGDAGAAMLRGARGFAAAGHTVDALTLAKRAIELRGPGDEAPAAAYAAALLDELGRASDAALVRVLAPSPGGWDGSDGRAAVDAAARAAAGPERRVALARLVHLAGSDDPLTAAAAAAVVRAQLAPARDPGVP